VAKKETAMKQFSVYLNYDHQTIVGRVELDETLSDEAIADCVLGPEIRLAANGTLLETVAFGMFPRVNTDISPRNI
jgi:hypothetical protein